MPIIHAPFINRTPVKWSNPTQLLDLAPTSYLKQPESTRTPVTLTLEVDGNGFREVVAKVCLVFLRKCLSCNCYKSLVEARNIVLGELNILSKACSTLTASFALVSK